MIPDGWKGYVILGLMALSCIPTFILHPWIMSAGMLGTCVIGYAGPPIYRRYNAWRIRIYKAGYPSDEYRGWRPGRSEVRNGP